MMPFLPQGDRYRDMTLDYNQTTRSAFVTNTRTRQCRRIPEPVRSGLFSVDLVIYKRSEQKLIDLIHEIAPAVASPTKNWCRLETALGEWHWAYSYTNS